MRNYASLISAIFCMALFAACPGVIDDDDPFIPPFVSGDVDKNELADAITGAEKLLTDTKKSDDGSGLANTDIFAPAEACNTFQAAVNQAAAVRDKSDATQAEVDSALASLEKSLSVFMGMRRTVAQKHVDKSELYIQSCCLYADQNKYGKVILNRGE